MTTIDQLIERLKDLSKLGFTKELTEAAAALVSLRETVRSRDAEIAELRACLGEIKTERLLKMNYTDANALAYQASVMQTEYQALHQWGTMLGIDGSPVINQKQGVSTVTGAPAEGGAEASNG